MLLLTALLLLPEMLPIPAGEQKVRDAATGFQVTVHTGAYLLGRTEVTQQQYEAVMGANPSYYKGANRPVENVTWQQAIQFANRLSLAAKLPPCYNEASGTRHPNCTGYRLPTNAEWQLAQGAPDNAAFRNTGYQDTQALLTAEKPGTREVKQSPPNQYGLHDMAGNVWEWCEDWFSPDPQLDAIRDPQGPLTGIAKVIRGGSFLTGGTQWNKGLLNSLEPQKHSPFTGLRLARTLYPAQLPKTPAPEYPPPPTNNPPKPTATNWQQILGTPNLPKKAPTPTLIRKFTDPTFTADLIDLNTEPNYPTRILITYPLRKPAGRLPVVIVPYYDVDTPTGADLGGRRYTAGGTRAFARLAAQRGMIAVSVKWYGEADGEGYDEAVYNLAKRHPNVTPLGKWIFDSQRVIDYLLTRLDVDPTKIGMIGHSLGGKMALYAAAFDERIKATVSSEPGLSLKFSNYADFWYLGKAIDKLPPTADQHDLIAYTSPRPFLLIAGESADGDKSIPYLSPNKNASFINHRTGHSPTEESVQKAMEWLERHLR